MDQPFILQTSPYRRLSSPLSLPSASRTLIRPLSQRLRPLALCHRAANIGYAAISHTQRIQ